MTRTSLIKALVSLAVFIVLSFFLSVLSAFFVAVLLAVVLLGVESKFTYLVALLLLIIAALFMVLNSNTAAEFFAVWSFYFLAIGILAQFRDGISMGAFEDLDS